MVLYTQSMDGMLRGFTFRDSQVRQGGHTEQRRGACNTGLSSKIPLGILKSLQGVIKPENCNDLTVLQHNNPSFA